MAYLLSTASGNWTSSSTWSAADTTNFIDSRTASTLLTTTPVANTSFTWATGAPTLQGIAVQLSVRAAAANGTMTAELYNVTGAASVRSVTVNVADLSTTFGAAGSTWIFFKFSSNVTLATGTNYAIRLSTSIASQISCYALATTNWSYQLITATAQAPTTNDSVIVTGTHTGVGAFSANTVTMDNTSATQYANVYVSNRGTLQFGVAASTNYALTTNGVAGTVFIVGYGGSFYIGGTGGNYLPSTSTATITLNCASALSTAINVFGTFITGSTYANAGGTGTGKPFNKLNADVAAGATGSTVSISTTGWKSGDQIVVPSTTRTAAQIEVITLNADQSGTSLSHGAYINAHGGNASTLVQADLANITRNITIKSGSTTFRSNFQTQLNSSVSLYGVKFQDLGTTLTVSTAGVCVPALTAANGGNFTMSYCVILNTTGNSTTLSGTGLFTTNDTNVTVSNNIFYNLGWTAAVTSCAIYGVNNNNMFLGNYSSAFGCASTYCGSNNVFSSNTVTSGGYSGGFYTNASNNSFYANSTNGLYFVGTNTFSTGMNNFYIWRNNTNGLGINSSATTNSRTTLWDFTNCYIFGNTTSGIVAIAACYTKITFINSYIYGGTTLVQTYGVNPSTLYIDTLYFSGCLFGYDNTATASPHVTANLFTPTRQAAILMYSCQFNGTEVSGQTPVAGYGTNSYGQSFVSINHNISGLNKQWLLNGTISGDSTTYNSTSPSLRMTPISSVYKLCSPTIKVPMMANTTSLPPRVGISIRKSSTNLMTYTEDVTNAAWLSDVTAVTRTANATTSPTGTLTADKIAESSTAASGWNIYQSISAATVIVGTTYVYSVYLKAAERQYARVSLGTSSVTNGGDIFVDLSSGTIFTFNTYGTATFQGYDIINAGNGWWRCVIAVSFAASAIIIPGVWIRNNNSGSTANYAGTVGYGLYIWGAMLYTDSGYISANLYPYEAVLTTPANTPYNGLPPRVMGVSNILTSFYPTDNSLSALNVTSSWYSNGALIYTVYGQGVIEFYVDCDGTQGWINIDDISFSPGGIAPIDASGTDYMAQYGNYIEADWRRPGGNFAFSN